MLAILRILLLFPSVTFSLFTAEIFPWAIIYTFYKKKLINFQTFLLGLLLLISSLGSLLYSLYYGVNSDVIRSFLAYLNPILIFFAIKNISKNEFLKLRNVVKYTLVFFIVLGICQFIGFARFLQPIFDLLLTRGSSESFGGGRGVSLFASEPSRAAYEFLFVYVAYLIVFEVKAKKRYFYDLGVAIFMIFVIRSGVGLFLLLIYLFSQYRLKFVIGLGALLFLAFPFFLASDSRAIGIMIKIIGSLNVLDVFDLLLKESGFRLISLISSYYYGIIHPLGGGVGLWEVTSVKALYDTGISPSEVSYFVYNHGSTYGPVRPTSFLASLMLDTGILGTSFFIYTLFPSLKVLWGRIKSSLPIFALFSFYLLCSGSIGNPIPWFCIGLCIKHYMFENENAED